MLHNIFLKTIRDYIRQIILWGGGLALLMASYAASYTSVFGSGIDRTKAIANYQKTIEAFSVLTGKVYDLDTLGGFINSKVSLMPLILGLWALLAGRALIRGEEERASMELLVSTSHTRTSILLQKWAGLGVALLMIASLSSLGLIIGATVVKADLDPLSVILAHLNWVLIALVFGGLALLFSQLTNGRAAAGWTGGIMVATYLLNNLVQNVEALKWTQYFNPFYYAGLSQPLARSVGTDWFGISVLVIIIICWIGLALWMFRQRDLNAFFEPFKNNQTIAGSGGFHKMAEPKTIWLSNNFTFGLRAALPSIISWGLGLSAYILLIMSVFNDIKGSMVDLLSSVALYKQLGFLNLTSNENILSLFVFLFLVLLVAAYAVTQVASWTSQENEGRLELILSTPQPRWQLLLTYFGVAIVSSALMVGLVGIIFAVSTWTFDVPVNVGNTIAAFLGLLIVCVIIEALGFVLAAFGPGWAVGVTAGLVILSYLSDSLQSLLKLPEALVNLSVFHQYGHPLVEGLQWTPQLIMLGLSIVFILIAIWQFRQRDLTK